MDTQQNDTTATTHIEKPANIIEQYKQYIAERTNRRDEIKVQMTALAQELKDINTELDGEKQDAKNIVSLMVQTRKRREDKAPAAVNPETGEPVKKRRGRKSNAQKEADAAAAANAAQ